MYWEFTTKKVGYYLLWLSVVYVKLFTIWFDWFLSTIGEPYYVYVQVSSTQLKMYLSKLQFISSLL